MHICLFQYLLVFGIGLVYEYLVKTEHLVKKKTEYLVKTEYNQKIVLSGLSQILPLMHK